MLTTESTTFTKDVMGRWVCNTLTEALDSANPGIHPGAQPFDVIIVGGGSFGGVFAQHVFGQDSSRRHRVLVLEAGKLALTEHVQNLPVGFGGLSSPTATSIADLRAIGQDKNPRNEVWGLAWHGNQKFPGLAYCLGGRSLFFGGWSPELLDSELVAWPAAARNDLKASYLAEAAGQIGTSVTNDFIYGLLHEALRRRVFDALGANQVADAVALGTLPDHWAARAPGITVADLAKLLGFDAPPPGATRQDLLNELKLEAPLAVQASGGRSGFFPFNKFSSLPLLMEAARAAQGESGGDDSRKRLMIVDDCHVTGLQRDGDRVSVIQTQQGPIDVPAAAVVVIALGTIESARLALVSTGNPRGLMGRNLMAHLRSNLTLRVPRAAFPGLPPDLEASALFVKGRHAGRHFHIQVTASGVVGNIGDSEAELFKKIPDVDFFDAHKLVTDDHVVITLRGIGEMQGDHTGAGSRVEQDPEPDEYLVPRAKVLLGTTVTDNALWDALDQAAIQLANAIAGGSPVEYLVPNSSPPQWSPNPPPSTPASQGGVRDGLGTTHHEAGTLWMGTDPNDSVTDDLGRFHDVPNLYATGPCLFPTVGSPNPMLTGVALARRTGDAVLAQATPTAEPGFTALFDGGSLTGWTMAGAGRFVVAGGALETEGGLGLLWYSAKQFADVELRLEWLTTHPGDNSGVYLRFADPAGDPFSAVNSGYEVQIDDAGAPDGATIHRTGAIYSFSPPLADAANPVGQWNQYQITVVGQQYTVRLNGTLVNKFTGNRALSGYVGLQNHHPGSRVVFRNIRARML
jgi:choline dehydrogenase-like flavoprotein